ncbi:MAG: TPM domain-containing protein [Oscillospiraceae bacterium]|nr:TPM domain-containing protein [Oscillospiraceae bacterium]
MIKFLKNSAAFLLSAVLCAGAFSITASAEDISYEDTPVDPAESVLVDDADMLTDEEEAELTKAIRETAEYIDMNILIFVSGTTIYTESGTMDFAEQLCIDAYGYDADSIVLYMDLSGHDDPSYSPYDFIYTRNRARFYYSGYTDLSDGGRIQTIFDEMNYYLPRCNEDVYSAAEVFLDNLNYFYDKGPDNSVRFFYVPDTGKYVTIESNGTLVHMDSKPINWGKAIMIGALIGLIAAVIMFFGVKSHYKFKSRPSSLQYIPFDQVQYGPQSDVFIRQYQTRTKIESSSGGSSGGGGGSRSGGGGGGNRR